MDDGHIVRDERCNNCDFWHQYDGRNGLCRRYPPTINPGDRDESDWPVTKEQYWCGEWESITDENPA
jgi:hypothetical protein